MVHCSDWPACDTSVLSEGLGDTPESVGLSTGFKNLKLEWRRSSATIDYHKLKLGRALDRNGGVVRKPGKEAMVFGMRFMTWRFEDRPEGR